jgi:hypothetical protein
MCGIVIVIIESWLAETIHPLQVTVWADEASRVVKGRPHWLVSCQ